MSGTTQFHTIQQNNYWENTRASSNKHIPLRITVHKDVSARFEQAKLSRILTQFNLVYGKGIKYPLDFSVKKTSILSEKGDYDKP